MVSAESQAAIEAARNAVQEFMARRGRNDTTVHEKVAPAVTHETITHKQHEEVTTAVDKETHQDHYHLSVQPVLDEETLEEQHHHQLVPVEQKTFEHDDPEEVQRRLDAERAKFRDEQVRVEGEKTHVVIPVVAGEHVHHHVHELIQPVITKQTLESHVIHITVPVHEIHHNAAQHHSSSALPAVSMAEFKRQGGILTGREERYDAFEGEPRSVGGTLGSVSDKGHPQQMSAAGVNSGSTEASSSNSHPGEARKIPVDKPSPRKDGDGDDKAGGSQKSNVATAVGPAVAGPTHSNQAQPAVNSGPAPPHLIQGGTTTASPIGPSQPPSAPPAPPQPAQQSHWSLLPTHLAKTAAAGIGAGAHVPAHMARPGRSNEGQQRQASVVGQQQQSSQEGQQGGQQAGQQQRRPSAS